MSEQLWKIHKQYYDLSNFLKKHPGGADMLLLGRGFDCTELFESVHNLAPIKVKKMLRPFLVRDIPADTITQIFEWKNDGFFYEVSRRVQQYFKESKLSHKATPKFWFWAFLTSVCWVLCFSLWIATSNILLAFISGFLGTSLGFSLFHTASHSALSKRPWINKLVTFFWGDFHGFHYPLWMQHHVISHHGFTGIHRKDPDIGNAVAFIRKHKKSRWNLYHKWQHLTALPILIIFPGQWLGQCLQYIQAMFKKKLFGMKIKRYISFRHIFISIPIIISSIALHFIIPINIHGFDYLWSFIAYAIAMNFTYWSIVFPNHDTVESHKNKEYAKDWGVQQVISSLSFRQPKWLSQFHGGMNFQIEHHLFPSVSPCHYPDISLIVRQCCLDFNIDYPFCDSWSKALSSHLVFLKSLAQKN